MTRLYSNDYSTNLNGAITDVATTMTVDSVTGLPAIGAGETCQLTIDDGVNVEIVTATAVSGLIITITRGQESTSGTAFTNGAAVELRATALSFIDPAGVIDFGAATSLEIPNGAAPTVDAAGEIAIDTTVTDHTGMIKFHDGTEELSVPGIPTANLTTVDGDIIAYNAANNEFEMVTPAGGGGGAGWNSVTSATASDSATLDFTGLTTYNQYMFSFVDIRPATDGAVSRFQLSTDNGSTFPVTHYSVGIYSSTSQLNSQTQDHFNITGAVVGSAISEEMNGAVILTRNATTTQRAFFTSIIRFEDTGGTSKTCSIQGVFVGATTADVDAIRFKFLVGNITSGTIYVFGR